MNKAITITSGFDQYKIEHALGFKAEGQTRRIKSLDENENSLLTPSTPATKKSVPKEVKMNKAVTLTSGKISINNDTKFGWFVPAGRLSSYKKGGSLSIDPIPDQFKAIYTQHSETHIWVKTGATALATLEVDGLSYPLRSTHIEKSTPTYWGDLNYNRYETLYPHPPKFTEVGQTRQIRILDANGNSLLTPSTPATKKSVPEVKMNKAITITSGVVAGTNNVLGWSVAKGNHPGYRKGGSLSIDPIPDQFIAIFSSVIGKTAVYVKTGTTAPATIEVDGVSYPITSDVVDVDGSLQWGGFNKDHYYTNGDPLDYTIGNPLGFTLIGQTKQIRILDVDGNVLLGAPSVIEVTEIVTITIDTTKEVKMDKEELKNKWEGLSKKDKKHIIILLIAIAIITFSVIKG